MFKVNNARLQRLVAHLRGGAKDDHKGPQRVLHQHLMKCGGTSVNSFLDCQYYANRTHDPRAIRPLTEACATNWVDGAQSKNRLNRALWTYLAKSYDCIHGHNPMIWAVGTSHTTVSILRNPVARVISQINDWRRLKDSDLRDPTPGNDEFKRFCRNSDYQTILNAAKKSKLSNNALINYQSKALARSLFPPGAKELVDLSDKETLRLAKKAIDTIDIIGVLEDLHGFYACLCKAMGWCPPRSEPALNLATSIPDISAATIATAQKLNALDVELYEYVLRKTAKNRSPSEFSTEDFENESAGASVQRLAPIFIHPRRYEFNFNMPIIGNGYFGRDASNRPECAIWTSKHTSLFFPSVSRCPMWIRLVYRGVSDERVLDSLVVSVDHKPFSVTAAGLLNRETQTIEIPHTTSREFVRLDFTSEVFCNDADTRMRGVCLDTYGYNLA
jgi:hypothetical protein